MTTVSTTDRAALATVIRALRRFNDIDSKMQVSTILTLLEIADAEYKGKDISIKELETSIGLLSGTASRNAYYWGEGHPQMRGGHEMIRIGFGVTDKRLRTLQLTNKGKTFMNNLLEGVRSNG